MWHATQLAQDEVLRLSEDAVQLVDISMVQLSRR